MDNLSLIVSSLQLKIKKLAQGHNKLHEENSKLIKEHDQMLQKVDEYKNTIYKLEEKNKVIKLAKTLAGANEDSVEVKLKINELVREIDKCIALLNR